MCPPAPVPRRARETQSLQQDALKVNTQANPPPKPFKMQMGGGQDWDPVVIRKKKPTNADLKDETAVNQARRSGVAIETEKKFAAGTNSKAAGATTSGKSAAKLDAETEDFHHDRVSSTLKTQIVQARTAKKMTQAQLAQAMNEKPQIIQEYESGKAIPNPQVLSKMSRVLGVTLKKGA